MPAKYAQRNFSKSSNTRKYQKNSKLRNFIASLKGSPKRRFRLLFAVLFATVGAYLLFNAFAADTSDATWYNYGPRVRFCESTHDYANNDTGNNGHYGAWQFSPQTWAGVARQYYPEAANYTYNIASASPYMQDKMAYHLFKDYGFSSTASWAASWSCANSSRPDGNPGPPLQYPTDSPPAGATPVSSVNPTGTDCHNYVLQYDPGTYYPCVQHLQNDLGITADGYFGPGTRQAVINKQAASGLSQTGTVDAATWCVIHTDLPGCTAAPAPAPEPAPAPTPSSQAVQGRIFRDDNGNGARDGSEPLIGNAGSCGNYVNVDASVSAAGQHVNADHCMDGPFYFIATGTGTVTVNGHAPAGWSHTNGNSRTVNVAAGQHVDVQWFGMRPTPAPAAAPPAPAPAPVLTAPAAGAARAIIGEGSSRCIDVAYGRRDNGGTILLWGCHGQANQQWTFDGNAIKIYGNKCLDIFGFNTSNQADVGIWDCHHQKNQQWYRPGDGTIRSALNGKCLDVEAMATHDGARIQMYDCHVGANQRWR